MSTSLGKIRRIQERMGEKVILRDQFKIPISEIGAVDIAFIEDSAITACIIVDYDSMKVKTKKIAKTKLTFPYTPTFLCFREGPPIIHMIKSMKSKPEIFFINAHGIAHPRFCGCASYIGVIANIATIGIASRNLCGTYNIEPKNVGDYGPLHYAGRTVGWILKSKEKCKPIFISPGHRIDLRSALDVSTKCIRNHKLPEPVQIAHTIANEEKRVLLSLNT